MYVLFLSTKVIAEIVMKDSSRKCHHDPKDLKKLERAKKRARRVAKDENLKIAIYRARVQMLEMPGVEQDKSKSYLENLAGLTLSQSSSCLRKERL